MWQRQVSKVLQLRMASGRDHYNNALATDFADFFNVFT